MTRIGIDIQSTVGRTTGLGVYTRHLTDALKNLPNPQFEYCWYLKKQGKDLNTFRRWYWENLELPAMVKKDKVDILHIPAFAPPFFTQQKVLVTVHDIIGMIFPNQLHAPSRWYWGQWLPSAIKRADFIIADSESTQHDLIQHLKISKDMIRVIYPSGHESFSRESNPKLQQQVKARFGISDRYFLFVGTIEPRKNLARVIEAFSIFLDAVKSGSRYQLVVVGQKDFGKGKLFKSITHDLRTKIDNTIFAGYVTHEELNQLYCGSEALVYPSLYEGFGIPILEAMASGVPVITARTTSIPEVAGEAAIYVDPESNQSIAEGMLHLQGDTRLRESAIQRGFEQLKKFSWKKTAQETCEVYQMLAGRK